MNHSETISEYNGSTDTFFPLLNDIATHSAFPHAQNALPRELYQFVLDEAIQLGYLSDTGLRTVAAAKMDLGLHTATPKLEAFYQYYMDRHSRRTGTECGSWVDWYGQVVCDVETLAHLAGVETIDSRGGMPQNS